MEDEKVLIKKAKDGENEAFGLLYDNYLPKIYRFVLLKVSHREEAEDLTHQAFLKAWENVHKYKDEGKYEGLPFSSWLYKIARNTVIDHYRSVRHTKTEVSIDEVSEEAIIFANDNSFDKDIDQKINLRKISDAIKKLKEIEQDIIIMRFIDDLPHEEVASVIGKSVGATKLIQHRAIKKLQQILKND